MGLPFFIKFLFDPQPWSEGSNKIESVCPSFRLSVSFLRIGSLVFSKTWHGVRDPNLVVCDSKIFLKKSSPGKNDQKWPKNKVFGLFKEIMSLVLSGICVKRKFFWFINIAWKLHAWEKSGSQVATKKCSCPMRFQYSLIVNISLVDEYQTLNFGTLGRLEWKEQWFINSFTEKKFWFGEMGYFGPKTDASLYLWKFF